MSFDELLFQLETATSIAAKERLVREFANRHTSPIIEDTRVTFFHISEDAHSVAIEGDWTHWQPTAPMSYLPDTPLWYRVERFPRGARLEYRLVINETRRVLDPRNPRTTPSGFGAHSELVMPDYLPPREIVDPPPATRGILEQHWIASQELDDRYTFWVNLPPRYDPQKKYPVAYFNDGDGYLHYAELPRIADYLIENRMVKPFIAVLIKPNDRRQEYARSNHYVRFLVNELVPWVDASYATINQPSARAIIGASFGALAAAHTARRRPQLFGLVGGQSGNYGFDRDALIRDYGQAPNLGIRFHLSVGDYETDIHGDGRAESDLVAAQRRFADLLRRKGYVLSCAEHPEGHQWGFWRAHIGEMLKFFWG